MAVLVTKSTPGRRKALLALAAAKRRNKTRIAQGLKPIVDGKKVSVASLSKHNGPGPHESGSPQTVHDPHEEGGGGQPSFVAQYNEEVGFDWQYDTARRRSIQNTWFEAARAEDKTQSFLLDMGYDQFGNDLHYSVSFEHIRDLYSWLSSQPLTPFGKHGGPGPHRNGSPQSVHGGDQPYWLDDVRLLRSRIQSQPEIAPEVKNWSFDRIKTLAEEMAQVEGSDDPEIGEEIHALTTLYYEADNIVETGTAIPELGDVDRTVDLAAAEAEWHERYSVPNPISGEYRDEFTVPPTPLGMDPNNPLAHMTSQMSIADGIYGHYEPPIAASELAYQDIIFHPRGPVMIDDIVFGGNIGPDQPPLDMGMMRVYGHRSDGEQVILDLAPDNQAPPYIANHILEGVGLAKHGGPGPHANGSPQSIHGNWSRGTSSRQLHNVTTSQGGSTTRLSSGEVPTTGWAVAQKRYSTEIKADQNPDANDIKRYIQSRWGALSQEGNYLGTWFDSETGSLWLDVTQVIPDGNDAYEWAKEQGEIAIFNLETFEEVTIDYFAVPAVSQGDLSQVG